MPHYNLYSEFGLDRTADCPTLAAALSNLITERRTSGEALNHELLDARTILSDPDLRRLYDRRLNDPSAPDITPSALHELTELQSQAPARPTEPSYPTDLDSRTTPTVSMTPSAPQDSGGHRRSTSLLPVIACTAVVGIAAGLASWVIFSSDGDDTGAAPTTTTVTGIPYPEKKVDAETKKEGFDPLLSGNYGYGTEASTRCDNNSANAAFVKKRYMSCDITNTVSSYLAGTAALPGYTKELPQDLISNPSNSESMMIGKCSGAEDEDGTPYWNCKVTPLFGEGVEEEFIIYP